jgi:hypothetical protein
MNKLYSLIILLIPITSFAQGCINGKFPSTPHYVCFDGRTIDKDNGGMVWNAKPGCFLSSVPCCKYDATHYAYYANPTKIGPSLARCKHDYPFRLGSLRQ